MVADLPNSSEALAAAPYLPVFNLDNIGEQLSLDFSADGGNHDGDGPAAAAAAAVIVLEPPTAATRAGLFDRMDEDRTGWLSLGEVSTALRQLYPQYENREVVLRAFRASDKSGAARLSRAEFGLFFSYLDTFNQLDVLFAQIDSSGDRKLSFEEFKTGARLVLPRRDSDLATDPEALAAAFAEMDGADEVQGSVEFDEFCMWAARRHVLGGGGESDCEPAS
eukprot:SAG22_NODE_3813_length_1519_cov_1.314085_1_plen_222_part_00